jgi:WD40 repeat protein
MRNREVIEDHILSDDFELYVRSTDKGLCTIHRVADNVEIADLPEFGERAEAKFGSGHMLAVCGSSRQFQLWDLTGAEPTCRFKERGVTGLWGCHFRADGHLLALAHMDGSISVYDVATGERVYRLLPKEIVNGVNPALHPSEPFVACFSYNHRPILIRDLRTGAVVASAIPPWAGGNGFCAWSPAGRRLLVTCGNEGTIQEYAFHPASPALRRRRLFQGPANRDRSGGAALSYHPAGDRFASRGWDGVVHLFDAVSGQCLFSAPPLSMPMSGAQGLRFNGTGQRLAATRVGKQQERVGLWSVADAREYRGLVHSGPGSTWLQPAVHPEGRLAAVGLEDGVVLFDLETGAQLTPFPALKDTTQVAFDGTGNLLTNSPMGFYRWPVRPDPVKCGRLLVGPPKPLPFPGGKSEISASRDGRVIAQSFWYRNTGGLILHPNAPAPRRVRAGLRTGPCSVSPDGRWVAFAPFVNVFDPASGKEVWPSPAHAEAKHCRFSPDGRWLATDGDGGRVYAAGSWEPGPQLGPGTPWDISPDSTLAIMGQTNGIYRLVELASGRELARLEDPELNTGAAAFTPDGTKLVVAAKNGLRVWDLRRIRAELAKLGLDWNTPPYPPLSQKKNLAPLEVTVDLGSLPFLAQARDYICLSQWDKAAAEYAKADLLAQPLRDDAFAYAGLFLIRGDSEGYQRFCQDMIQRVPPTEAPSPYEAYVLARSCALARKSPVDPARAVQWANQAFTAAPHPWRLHTLGLAQYRAGQFDQALQSFTKADVKAWTDREVTGFGLALVHHRLGHPEEARRCLDKGIQWLERVGPPGPEQPAKLLPQDWLEAQLLRREAEETLKIKQSP